MIKLDVRDLLGAPGSSRSVSVKEPVAGLAAGLAEIPEDRPVHARLLLESVVEGVLVSGPLSGRMLLTCARCLRLFDQEFRVEVQELFASDAGEEEYVLSEGFADLEPMIRDAVLLAMPFSPLCRSSCLGLCERCGGDRNIGACSCATPQGDPRWSVLANLDLGGGPNATGSTS